MAKPFYCRRCGNPDCPLVSADPYWRRCPGKRKVEWYRDWLLHIYEEFASSPLLRQELLAPVYAATGIDHIETTIDLASAAEIRAWTKYAEDFLEKELTPCRYRKS